MKKRKSGTKSAGNRVRKIWGGGGKNSARGEPGDSKKTKGNSKRGDHMEQKEKQPKTHLKVREVGLTETRESRELPQSRKISNTCSIG